MEDRKTRVKALRVGYNLRNTGATVRPRDRRQLTHDISVAPYEGHDKDMLGRATDVEEC